MIVALLSGTVTKRVNGWIGLMVDINSCVGNLFAALCSFVLKSPMEGARTGARDMGPEGDMGLLFA